MVPGRHGRLAPSGVGAASSPMGDRVGSLEVPQTLSVDLRNRRSQARILSGALPDSEAHAHVQGLRALRPGLAFVARKLVSDSRRFSGDFFGDYRTQRRSGAAGAVSPVVLRWSTRKVRALVFVVVACTVPVS